MEDKMEKKEEFPKKKQTMIWMKEEQRKGVRGAA